MRSARQSSADGGSYRNYRNGAAQGLKTGQDRFYTFTIDPSQTELAHIGGDADKLRDYTRSVVANYAANSGKGIEGQGTRV